MAHFALVDENNIVLRVLVTDNNHPDGDEGYQWLVKKFGGRWIKTSYNTSHNEHGFGGTPLRGNFAGIGMTYDEGLDVFLYPKPFPSWNLNEDTAHWEAPVPAPEGLYDWDEATLSWIEVTE
jgi:hypothetical protein